MSAGQQAGLSAELSTALTEVTGADVRFGHRQHIHLAFIAARRHGPEQAPDLLCDWIKQIAAGEGVPQKFHATLTIAWATIVARHAVADPCVADFDDFASRYPALMDKGLLARHYTPATLGSVAARNGWVAPDLMEL